MFKISSKNKTGILLMFFSACFVCIGQLFWKLSNLYGLTHLIAGFIFYLLGSLLMIKAYHYGELNVLQPILSIGYIFSLVLGFTILNEDINILNVVGVFLIILGVLFIISGDNE